MRNERQLRSPRERVSDSMAAFDLNIVEAADAVESEVVALPILGKLVSLDASLRHRHRKGQLLYTIRGLLHCEAEGAILAVPQHCAIWIPPGISHATFGVGEIEAVGLFIDRAVSSGLPATCGIITIDGLLHALIVRLGSMKDTAVSSERRQRLVDVLTDELSSALPMGLRLPVPGAGPFHDLVSSLVKNPQTRATSDDCAAMVAMSRRSFDRHFHAAVGMSYVQWQRLLHVTAALTRIAEGQSITTVAIDLGYEGPSSFSTMFKRVTGQAPSAYLPRA